MTVALAFLRRYWPDIVAVLLIIGLSAALLLTRVTLATRTGQRDAEHSAHALTVANYRKASAQAQRDAEANAKRVLLEQQKITQEVSNGYQAQLADVRARADALRVRLASAPANPGSAGSGRAPAVSNAAGRPDGAAAQDGLPSDAWSLEDRVIATEQALQLAALQAWLRQQTAVEGWLQSKPSTHE